MVEGLTIPTVGPPPPGGFGHAGGAGPGLIIPNVGGSGDGGGWTGYGSGNVSPSPYPPPPSPCQGVEGTIGPCGCTKCAARWQMTAHYHCHLITLLHRRNTVLGSPTTLLTLSLCEFGAPTSLARAGVPFRQPLQIDVR